MKMVDRKGGQKLNKVDRGFRMTGVSSSPVVSFAMNCERAASNSSKTLYDSSRSICPATGINTSAPKMTTTSITRRSTSPASNAALWATIATMEHRWRMLMFNGWSNLRMWETHLSEGIQIFRIVSDKWVSFFIRPDKCTPESETFTEHLSEGIRIFLIASDNWYLFYSEHFSEAYK